MRLGLVLGEVWNGLRRNLSVVISVILVTSVSLTFVGAAILMQLQVQQMKTFWYDRAQVAIYLCTDFDQSATCDGNDASEEQIAAVEDAPRRRGHAARTRLLLGPLLGFGEGARGLRPAASGSAP